MSLLAYATTSVQKTASVPPAASAVGRNRRSEVHVRIQMSNVVGSDICHSLTCVYVCLYECDRSFEGVLAHSNGVTGCNGTPKVEWQNCDIHLCFTSTTNCFMKFYIGHVQTHTCMHTCMNTYTLSLHRLSERYVCVTWLQ